MGRVQGLLLTPGAGSDRDHHTLVALEAALAPLPVERVDFPYRKEGRKAPDRAPKLIASLVDDAARFSGESGVSPERIVLGGRSMGGRMCSMAVAEGLPAAGLVLISYPLHPPGKPEKLRIEHLPALDLTCPRSRCHACSCPATAIRSARPRSWRRPPRRSPAR